MEEFPKAEAVRVRHIDDSYIDGAWLRLREQTEDNSATQFKLTKKTPMPAAGAQQGFITTIYLTAYEFQLLAQLPAKMLCKTRYSMPPFGIDVFEGELAGLRLAEAEFDSASEADTLVLPPYIRHEVTDDIRFTGGQLVNTSRDGLRKWLAEYGVELPGPESS